MKVLKILWFVLSITMIITSGYFLYSNNNPKSDTKNINNTKKVVKETSLNYLGDTVALKDGVTNDQAKDLLKSFDSSLSINSWFWLPEEGFDDLNKLDNEYRLTIASNRIKIISSKTDESEKYELSTNGVKSTLTKIQLKTAWENTVGLGVSLTDGTPCVTIKYCRQHFVYNKLKDYYEVVDPSGEWTLSVVKYTDINKVGNKFTLNIKALYFDKDTNYTVYTTPKMDVKIAEPTEAIGSKPETAFIRELANKYIDKANTYSYEFTREGESYNLSGFKVIKK